MMSQLVPPQLFCADCGRPTITRIEVRGDEAIVWQQCPVWGTYFRWFLLNQRGHTLQHRGWQSRAGRFDPNTGERRSQS